jgi:hypothetical protein
VDWDAVEVSGSAWDQEHVKDVGDLEASNAHIKVRSADGDAMEVSSSGWDQEHTEDMGDLEVSDTHVEVGLVDRDSSSGHNDHDDDQEVNAELNQGDSRLEFWDEIGESLECNLATIGNVISLWLHVSLLNSIVGDDFNEQDKLILCAFALKIRNHLTDDTFKQLPFVFKSDPLSNWKATRSHVAFLSGLDPVLYDCCPNSCCCYVDPHTTLDRCPYCDTPQYNSDWQLRKVFVYIPLIPHLVALY